VKVGLGDEGFLSLETPQAAGLDWGEAHVKGDALATRVLRIQ
jgi:hypothetical protein